MVIAAVAATAHYISHIQNHHIWISV